MKQPLIKKFLRTFPVVQGKRGKFVNTPNMFSQGTPYSLYSPYSTHSAILTVETGLGSGGGQSNPPEVPMGSLTIWLRWPILWLRRPNLCI